MNDDSRRQVAQALVMTGVVLYVPSNVIPVMRMTVVGEVEPLTVFGGVQELWESGLAPAALIVFIASIMVPFLKLAILTWLLLLDGTKKFRRHRTALHRTIKTVGVWSMVDIFLLSILVAVGQLGILASVEAKPGAFFFAAVLLSSLFAAEIYPSRMIWESARQERTA